MLSMKAETDFRVVDHEDMRLHIGIRKSAS